MTDSRWSERITLGVAALLLAIYFGSSLLFFVQVVLPAWLHGARVAF